MHQRSLVLSVIDLQAGSIGLVHDSFNRRLYDPASVQRHRDASPTLNSRCGCFGTGGMYAQGGLVFNLAATQRGASNAMTIFRPAGHEAGGPL